MARCPGCGSPMNLTWSSNTTETEPPPWALMTCPWCGYIEKKEKEAFLREKLGEAFCRILSEEVRFRDSMGDWQPMMGEVREMSARLLDEVFEGLRRESVKEAKEDVLHQISEP